MLIIGTILAVGFVTTNLISLRVSSQTLKATILENELPLTSSNIYSEIQADLLKPVFVSSQMANDTFVKDWILAGEQDLFSVTRYLDAVRERYKVFTSFVISDRSHKYYHFSGLSRVVDEASPDDVWFFRVRDMTEPYEINIDYNKEAGGELTIFVNYRMLDYDGNFLAVTGVGLKIDTVAKVLRRFEEAGRSVYFIDRNGAFTVRPAGMPDVVNIKDVPELKDVAPRMLASEQGYFEYTRASGESMLFTTRLIPQLGWYVVVEQSEDEALKSLWRGFFTNLAIGLVIVIVTIGTIAYFVGSYHRQLEGMATTDKLTGIGNRQFFDIAIDHALKIRKRTTRPFAVILIDLDHFKSINDTLGHLAGDAVIRAVTDVVRQNIRESDVLCRWGGEELIILAADCQLEAATELAEKLRHRVEQAELPHGAKVTISAGIAEATDDEDADGVLGRADDALYEAKETGRNRVVVAAAQAKERRRP